MKSYDNFRDFVNDVIYEFPLKTIDKGTKVFFKHLNNQQFNYEDCVELLKFLNAIENEVYNDCFRSYRILNKERIVINNMSYFKLSKQTKMLKEESELFDKFLLYKYIINFVVYNKDSYLVCSLIKK